MKLLHERVTHRCLQLSIMTQNFFLRLDFLRFLIEIFLQYFEVDSISDATCDIFSVMVTASSALTFSSTFFEKLDMVIVFSFCGEIPVDIAAFNRNPASKY